MTGTNGTILVAGATGKQGGATVRHVLADGWAVRALTCDPGRPEAKALADAGDEATIPRGPRSLPPSSGDPCAL